MTKPAAPTPTTNACPMEIAARVDRLFGDQVDDLEFADLVDRAIAHARRAGA